MSYRTVQVAEVALDVSYGLNLSAESKTTNNKLLRITDIQNGLVNWENVPYCTPKSDKELVKAKLQTGDIVFARTGATTGKSYLILKIA